MSSEMLPFCSASTVKILCSEMSEIAVKAAVNFVQIACQQIAFVAGKGLIEEDLQTYKMGMLP